MAKVKQMKWWGWGEENKDFDHVKRPYFWDYVSQSIDIQETKTTKPIDFNSIKIQDSLFGEKEFASFLNIFNKSQIKTDKLNRIEHAYGKSYRDLFRARNGKFNIIPDVVFYPKQSKQIQFLLTEHLHIFPKKVW